MKRNRLTITVSVMALAALTGFGTALAGDTTPAVEQAAAIADIVRAPTDLPPAIDYREPRTVRVDLETVRAHRPARWRRDLPLLTFNGKVPGPMVRVHVGDTVEVGMKNTSSA